MDENENVKKDGKDIYLLTWGDGFKVICQFARASVTKHRRLGGLNDGHWLPCSLEAVCWPRTPVQQSWFLLRGSREGLFHASLLVAGGLLTISYIYHLSLCLLVYNEISLCVFMLCVCVYVCFSVQISPFYKDIVILC